jgi:hypothetical protein
MNSFWFTPRPKEVEHHHPFLVFDGNDRLHLPLTIITPLNGSRIILCYWYLPRGGNEVEMAIGACLLSSTQGPQLNCPLTDARK